MKTSGAFALLLFACAPDSAVSPEVQRSESAFVSAYNANQCDVAAAAVSANPAMKRMLAPMLSETRSLLGAFALEGERAHVPSGAGFKLAGDSADLTHALGGHFEKYPGAFIFDIKKEGTSFRIVGLQVYYDGPQSVIDPLLARIAHDTAEMISPKKP